MDAEPADTRAQVLVGQVTQDSPGPIERLTGPPATMRYAVVPEGSVRTNARQPRAVFDDDALDELADSIALVGLLQPLVVRPLGSAAEDGYELVAGERRLRCLRRLGWDTVPVLIRLTQDTDMLRDALVENLHRADLNPLEEAAAYQQLLVDFGCTHEELADRLGRSRPQITNTVRLLRLPPGVQRRVAAGVLSAGHARALLALPNPTSMEALAARIVAEGLSVRSVEEIVAVGDVEPANPPRRRPRAQGDARHDLAPYANALTDRLDTRVQVTMGRRRGRVTIEFAGVEDLERIMSVLSEGESQTWDTAHDIGPT